MLLRRSAMDHFIMGIKEGELGYYLLPFRANEALSAIPPVLNVDDPWKATDKGPVYLLAELTTFGCRGP